MLGQFIGENQKSCYLCRVAGSGQALLETAGAKRSEFSFLSPQVKSLEPDKLCPEIFPDREEASRPAKI
jgi:hypothetical protein